MTLPRAKLPHSGRWAESLPPLPNASTLLAKVDSLEGRIVALRRLLQPLSRAHGSMTAI